MQEINISLPWPLSDRSEVSLDAPQALVVFIKEKLFKTRERLNKMLSSSDFCLRGRIRARV